MDMARMEAQIQGCINFFIGVKQVILKDPCANKCAGSGPAEIESGSPAVEI